jgi:hypothetical protein
MQIEGEKIYIKNVKKNTGGKKLFKNQNNKKKKSIHV